MGNATIIVLRIFHIAAGAFWLGGSVTTAFFLLPTVKATGPVGGQFAGALMPRRTGLPEWLTAAGAVAVATGLLLYWNFYAGLAWTGFEPQVVIGIGGFLAILSLAIGLFFSRPTADRMAVLGKTIQSQGTPPTPVQDRRKPRASGTVDYPSGSEHDTGCDHGHLHGNRPLRRVERSTASSREKGLRRGRSERCTRPQGRLPLG